MRVIQYNIYRGGNSRSGDNRVPKLGQWLASKSYDVAGLNELNGWDEPGIEAFAKTYGYSGAAVFAKSPYPIGVITRLPLAVIEKRGDGFYHGVLHVAIEGVHFMIVHLTPYSAEDRLAEVENLLGMAHQIAEPLFLMGDMNALYPFDKPYHDASSLVDHLKATDRLRKKFMRADGSIDYEPMQLILDGGFKDVCPPGGRTVPTEIVEDEMHVAPMRLDYILANSQALALSPTVSIVSEPENYTMSDHLPIECVWQGAA